MTSSFLPPSLHARALLTLLCLLACFLPFPSRSPQFLAARSMSVPSPSILRIHPGSDGQFYRPQVRLHDSEQSSSVMVTRKKSWSAHSSHLPRPSSVSMEVWRLNTTREEIGRTIDYLSGK
ncbi:hypothetical protein BO70DRAFT_60194 [Aspergillus heteromorphus CBS 117.55]|uniref:Uncharacterized protein n=1 Tax=Aspergillus heteromorphus CBS 117.55 TaxID=1448321 RepID=A0A317VV23_9EURO|nr:uncharacterized protein BO70DRAFT_60194 [Aspergillus heteromorphus CBS 117.55]PWY78236.1 hypothetical protein BO70DRAFT_60194 [Aspergillus heteromorphus CBS 117.55]